MQKKIIISKNYIVIIKILITRTFVRKKNCYFEHE